MAYESNRNAFTPLIIGAIAVVVALVLFLMFRPGDGTQQAGVNNNPPPPAATTPAPKTTTPAPAPAK